MANQSPPTGPVYDAPTVGKLLGIDYTAEQLAAFGPPPEPIEGFITFFDPGWSIVRLREGVQGKGTIFHPQSWYNAQDFAKKADLPRYHQLRMEAVKDSFGKTFAEQLKLLSNDEEIPLARVAVTAMVLHFLASKQRLFPSFYVRCADWASDGSRVDVGDFDGGGLSVVSAWDDYPYAYIGVAASRNVP